MIGLFFAAISVFFYALLSPLAKKIGVEGVPPLLFITIANFVLFVMGGIGYVFFERNTASFAISSNQWIMLGVFGALNFIGYVFYLLALKEISAVSYQLMGFLIPIVGAGLSYILFKELVTVRMMIGYAIIVVGLFVALYKTKSGVAA